MKNIFILAILLIVIGNVSCKKYLEAKSDPKLSTPNTTLDLQGILDNYGALNLALKFTNNFSDEYFIDYSYWNTRGKDDKDSYVWAPQLFVTPGQTDDWVNEYQAVFYANTVLDNLKNISPENQEEKWDHIKGQALFFRAYAFFELLQLYANQYDPNTSNNDLGIVLRLTSDFNKSSTRTSVKNSYDQVLNDLHDAVKLLSKTILPIGNENKTRPTKAAAFGLLARVYLQMGDYSMAKLNSDSCLNLYSKLLTYNDFASAGNTTLSFKRFSDEVIFYTGTQNVLTSLSNSVKVDTALVQLYATNDLRKKLYFMTVTGGVRFKGSYNQSLSNIFNGIATDEIYLVRAEASARLGNTNAAISDLNTLLEKRWVTGTFVQRTATDANDVLNQVLLERRKELVFRGVRWSDLKRLNKESRFAITLTRNLNGAIYNLPPNDLRYSMLIPLSVVNMTGIQQNPR